MKIAHITAGAAGMYCGSCMHDNTLAGALQQQGVDVALIPTYTPIRTDEVDVSIDRVFFGGINVYLQQKYRFFRHTPAFVDKLFESRALLNWVSRFSASTNARDLGALTVSVLKGESGHQRKELAKLVDWLKDEFQPDLVQIPNSMFAGFARLVKQRLGVPVLCALQGEDLFLEDLVEPFHGQALALLRERARDIDGFIANSVYYRDYMAPYLDVPPEKIHVVPLGLALEGHGAGDQAPPPESPFVIGFLARLCPEKGLHVMVDAFKLLAEDLGKDKLRLRIAGYLSPKDRDYVADLKQKVEAWGYADIVSFEGEVTREEKIRFLNGLHVFSVPAPYKEPKGIYLLEAMANGVPVVQPDHGAYSGLVSDTGGGLLVTPESPRDLAAGLKRLAQDAALRQELGRKGKTRVHQAYTSQAMAAKTRDLYRQYLGKP